MMESMFLCTTRLRVMPLTNKYDHLCFARLRPFPKSSYGILKTPIRFPSPFTSRFTVNCIENERGEVEGDSFSTSFAYEVLGVDQNCSNAELKAAFRARVKQFHPDVSEDGRDSDLMIRRVIRAYEMVSKFNRSEIIEREYLDPFEEPECEALDVFINEVLCVGKACPYSCVKRAPHAFSFVSSTGTARATSQGHGDDYHVQLAVGQCPRSCIHYVTPSQRVALEEILDSILSLPCDTSAEADLLYSLITKAKFENNRYRKPKKKPKASSQHVDWF